MATQQLKELRIGDEFTIPGSATLYTKKSLVNSLTNKCTCTYFVLRSGKYYRRPSQATKSIHGLTEVHLVTHAETIEL